MKISIVTVCKDSELYIEQAIKSVISQTYKNIEYIIIDGDSKDSTKQIVAKYSGYITHFISEPDNGLYEAMNKGIKLATGEFINFLNSDDYFYDDHVVEDIVNFINEHPDCAMLYGDTHIRPDPKMSSQSSISKPPLPSEVPQAMIYGSLFLQGAIFFRRDLFSKLGLFSESYKISADYEWFTRLVQNEALTMLYYPRTIFSFYQGGISGNVTTTLKEMFEIQNQVIMYQSNDWQRIRILKLQSSIIELQDFIQKIQFLSEERRILIEGIKNPFSKTFLKVFFSKLSSKLKLAISSLRSR